MKIDKVGILLPHLHNNQMGYEVTKQLNNLKNTHPYIDSIVFTEDERPQTLIPKFAIMNVCEAYDQTGLLIATTPSTASKLIYCWGANHKVFYSYDCFWLRGNRNQYEGLLNLYLNKEFDVIVRSESHQTLLANNFNVRAKAIVEGFDILEFIRLYEENSIQEAKEEVKECQTY
jgi:hypothetical protein